MNHFFERFTLALRRLGHGTANQAKPLHGDRQTAVERLGCPIPDALASFFEATVANEQLIRAHDRLLRWDQLIVRDGKLVFLEENQQVAVWGVDPTDDPDPAVFVAANENQLDWTPQHPSCSGFLIAHLYFQATMGGLPHGASATTAVDPTNEANQLGRFMGAIDSLRAYDFGIGRAVTILPQIDCWELRFGSASRDGLESIADALSMTFGDGAWLDD